METKKKRTNASKGDFSLSKVRDFVGEIKAEIQRINWTSWEELQVYTKIVVAATFMLGMGIFFTDLIIQRLLTSIGTIIHWIGG